MAEDIQQQIADGAGPRLARVGDVIEHGQDIPPNVVRMRDKQGGEGRAWVRTQADPLRFVYRTVGERDGNDCHASVLEARPNWWPMTVVEVDPEPQPEIIIKPSAPMALGDVDSELVTRLRVMAGRWGALGVAKVAAMLAEPATSPGPLVLSLPQVPDEAVALVDVNARRWARSFTAVDGEQRWDTTGPYGARTLGELLADGLGPLVVEVAPPREPRTWPKLPLRDPPITDPPEFAEVGGHGTWGLRSDGLYAETDGYPDDVDRRYCLTLTQLRELGDVREVLT